jgi:AraC-like DNA-binding protein
VRPLGAQSARLRYATATMLIERPPCPALAPWVSRVWIAQGRPASTGPWRERMVPTGGFHLVLRLDDSHIRIFEGLEDPRGQTFTAVVGGARSRFHVREAAVGARAVGMQIRPGGAGVILGIPAQALAERHTALEDVWGPEAHALRERLLATRPAARQLRLLEEAVAARLRPRFAPHPAVQQALARFGSEATGWEVGRVTRETGLSHRRFVELFRGQVGLGPKQLCRVLRLGRALRLAAAGGSTWAATAAIAGYSDQSHLVRELRAIAGVSPTEWSVAGPYAHHIPVVKFLQDRGGPARLERSP